MSRSPSRGPCVLVVEDEAPICMVLEEALCDDGFEVLCAQGDQQAYEMLERYWTWIEALVTDVNLGAGTTGYDVARAARRLNPNLPVIYTTGRPEHTVLRHAVSGGVLVAKPYELSQLLAALRRLLPEAV